MYIDLKEIILNSVWERMLYDKSRMLSTLVEKYKFVNVSSILPRYVVSSRPLNVYCYTL